MKGKNKTQKGITLISLIITIVVLLILAAVAISSIQNDGILHYAQNAADNWNKAMADEANMLGDYLNYLNNMGLGNGGGTTIGDATVDVKVGKISTINGQQYSENNPVIPAGFMAINTTTSNWDAADLATEVKKGLVISDGTSEFVWIPVASINSMIMCQTHGASVTLNEETLQCPTCGESTKLAGKLYATLTGEKFYISLTGQTYGLNTGLREPDVVTSASGTDSTTGSFYDAENLSTVLEGDYANTQTAGSFKLQLEEEFKNMAQSVAKYKGFYVGRYETSLNGTTAQSKSEETPMNKINWYNMYKNSKTYSRANTELGVVSEMIWGCQWDAMMQLILTGPDASHVTATTNVGHTSTEFTSKPYETGGTNYTEVYTGSTTYNDIASNIYDLEGNVEECTQEAHETYDRVYRGSSYSNSGGASPSNRYSRTPSFTRGRRLPWFAHVALCRTVSCENRSLISKYNSFNST